MFSLPGEVWLIDNYSIKFYSTEAINIGKRNILLRTVLDCT
jgi:hypothetical protein